MEKSRFDGKLGAEYELFKQCCPHYDELEDRIGFMIMTDRGLLRTAPVETLEIGCGIGYTTDSIIRHFRFANITSIDNSNVMIKQAEDYLKDYIDQGRVRLVEADALDYLKKSESESFEVLASGFAIHNFKQDYRKEFLKEAFRVLKKGGVFVNGDKYANDDTEKHVKDLAWQIQQLDLYDKCGRPDLKEKWIEHYIRDDQPDIIMREGEAIQQMKDNGFKHVNTFYRERLEAVVVGVK